MKIRYAIKSDSIFLSPMGATAGHWIREDGACGR